MIASRFKEMNALYWPLPGRLSRTADFPLASRANMNVLAVNGLAL
jgi:hypothetical protein